MYLNSEKQNFPPITQISREGSLIIFCFQAWWLVWQLLFLFYFCFIIYIVRLTLWWTKNLNHWNVVVNVSLFFAWSNTYNQSLQLMVFWHLFVFLDGGVLRGDYAVTVVKQEAHLQCPERILCTNLRKYMATLIQVWL